MTAPAPDHLDVLDANLERTRRLLDEAEPAALAADIVADILALCGALQHLIHRYNHIIDSTDF